MWQYCWTHILFHAVQQFPRWDRHRMKASERFCEQDLMGMTVAITLSMCLMLCLTICFICLEPVPSWLKTAFHLCSIPYGLIAFLSYSMVTAATSCKHTTPTLYAFVHITSILGIMATVLFALLALVWLHERLHPGSMLDTKGRSGACYGIHQTVPCVWHV
eukprot:TRINITY_DN8298_c0_g1_i2.p1 TRINITY_DN8298_c0_g1~~TRINITY_DN8298_c0_g1_i2.p1  ORF type:complete len:161 (+),score=5.13 TRINITY_DN8298_c0_g1_i2:72-554(+)